MPKIVDTTSLKNEIIKNAFDVFIEKGYYKTSMLDITQRCNMKRTTLYHYFKNKDEVFEHTIYYIIDTLENDVNEMANTDDMKLKDKIKYLNNKWEKDFKNSNIILLLTEMWLVIKREDNEISKRIRSRVIKANKSLNKLVLTKARMRVTNKKENLELLQYSFITSILRQVSIGNGFLNESVISLLTSMDELV